MDDKKPEKREEELTEEQRRIARLTEKSERVIDVMEKNIQDSIQRGESLGDLHEKTSELEAQTGVFKKTARRVRWRLWLKNMGLLLVILAVLSLLVFFFFFKLF
ncbi:MAG: vesicle-associated membrane protein 8 [Amphiamblys sp. WSBS2006]|nr:MAG: vesicle-associated membrane protein 8 [Amphiamblys sp. WSBS2006]